MTVSKLNWSALWLVVALLLSLTDVCKGELYSYYFMPVLCLVHCHSYYELASETRLLLLYIYSHDNLIRYKESTYYIQFQ